MRSDRSTPRSRWTAVTAAALLATAVVACRPVSAAPTTSPTTQPLAARTKETVVKTLKTDLTAFRAAFTGRQLLTDGVARAKAAPTVLPVMAKVYADFGALAEVEPAAQEQADGARAEFTTMMATLGDAGAAARLSAQANSADPAVATEGQGQQLLVQWWTTAQDPAAQAKVADQVEALAKGHADSLPLTQQLVTMSQMGSASPALRARVRSLVTDVMRNEIAEQAKQQIAADRKMEALADKPMTIAGRTVDGKDLTTADWKGKVILVDFWATWCAPCVAELPRVRKVFADNHDKGLEVVGVSNDAAAADLTKFLGENPKMPWPQLFDAAAAAKREMNPITLGFGINGIPTLFLIDKKGICRTVEAGDNMEEMIPKLLAEK